MQINTTTSAFSQANAKYFQVDLYELMALAAGTSTVFAKSADLRYRAVCLAGVEQDGA
ncbi:MAG: hypothetical protein IPK68_23595 [Bdellovibrionales bacterium]|nr:hypothetical protein [Bdellovibrionales bacterium]